MTAEIIGDRVVIDAAEAARLAPLVLGEVRRARLNGRALPPDLLQVATTFAAAERAAAARTRVRPPLPERASTPATSSADGDGRDPLPGRSVGSVGAARLAGVSQRSVNRAAAEGRLVGRPDPDGAWVFTEDAVRAWIERRQQRMAALLTKRADADRAAALDGMRRDRIALDVRLAEMDREQSVLEFRRDSAANLLAALEAGGGDAVQEWRIRETLAEVEADLQALVARRRPVAETRNRLAAALAPLDAKERNLAEAIRQERALAGLHGVASNVPQLIADLERAERDLLAEGLRLPSRWKAFLQVFRVDERGPEHGGPAWMNLHANANLADATARRKRLQGEAA